MLFGSNPQLNKCTSDPLLFDGDLIDMSRCVKYLGGHLDKNLTFKDHITKKCRAAMINYNMIKSIRKVLTKETCTTLVITLCISHLDFGNALLYGLPEKSIAQLQRVQNICAKLVLNRSKYDSNTECLKELHWLPIRKRIEFKILSLMFNAVKGDAPMYLKNMIKPKSINRLTRRSELHYILEIPRTKSKTFGPRAFEVSGPTLWNSIPDSLRLNVNLSTFKKSLKTHLFNCVYN